MKQGWLVCGWLLSAWVGAALADTHTDLEFAVEAGQPLLLDVHLPEPAAEAHPLVVWIHGGGWKGGDKENCPIRWMTDHGYAVASINYRLSDTSIFPAQIHDCKGAIRWLRARADTYHLDPGRVAVAGASAGAYLAVLVGTSADVDFCEGSVGGNEEQSSRVHAVIDFYGATDFILRSKTQPHRANEEGSVVYKLLGGGADQKVELARKASSAFYVSPDDPPLLIFHGDADETVLFDQSQRIHQAYQDHGLSSKLLVTPGAGHDGISFVSPENKGHMLQFLQEALELQASALPEAPSE